MTLRLRCLRCGGWADLDAKAVAWFGLCDACISKWYAWRDAGISYNKRKSVFYRHRLAMTGHPTYKALTAELVRLESVTPGAVDEGAISIGAPDSEDDVIALMWAML